jgi:tRNA threonylcarbamoyladenosine biosynthesis protein TsaE
VKEEIVTNSNGETKRFAKKIAAKLTKGTLLCLYGNLGGGKTTFTQGFSSYFNVNRIISPTFVLMRSYNIHNSPKFDFLHHIDLYRLDDPQSIRNLGIIELLSDKKNIVIIEWAEKMTNLPEKRIDIFFEYLGENKRKITILYSNQ